jgi:hypothetical protein
MAIGGHDADLITYGQKAVDEFPDNPDFLVFLGKTLSRVQMYDFAYSVYKRMEKLLDTTTGINVNTVLENPAVLWIDFAVVASKVDRLSDVVKYITLALKERKYNEAALNVLLVAFADERYAVEPVEVFGVLAKLYDFTDVKDKMFVAKAAQKAGQTELAYLVVHNNDEVIV